MRTTLALAALVLTASLNVAPAFADTRPQATLRVTIVDQTNAVLPHAVVTIYTLDGQPGVRAVADEHGVVYLPTIAAGLTQIVASHPGFAPAFEKATLKAGANASTVRLELAPIVEKVTVSAPAQPARRS